MKILLGDFKAKGGEMIFFKLATWNDSLHEDTNDNGVNAVNSATS
jgi:hypothetical protein